MIGDPLGSLSAQELGVMALRYGLPRDATADEIHAEAKRQARARHQESTDAKAKAFADHLGSHGPLNLVDRYDTEIRLLFVDEAHRAAWMQRVSAVAGFPGELFDIVRKSTPPVLTFTVGRELVISGSASFEYGKRGK